MLFFNNQYKVIYLLRFVWILRVQRPKSQNISSWHHFLSLLIAVAIMFTNDTAQSVPVTAERSANSFGQYSSIFSFNMVVRIMPWLGEETKLLPHQEAAILLEYARDGQDLNGSNLTLRSRNCYRYRHKYQWLARLAAWSMVLIHIFQRPTWTYKLDREGDWKNHDLYPSFDLAYLNPVACNVLYALCLAVLWTATTLEFGYKRYTSNINLVYMSTVILAIKSVTVLVCFVDLGLRRDPLFSSSPIEALMCLLVEQQYDNNIGYIRRTVPKFAVLMLVLACFICTYTAVGFLIFDPDSTESTEYFPTFGTGVWNMLMVLNGSNWPAPMIPAFQENRLYCLYFYTYIILVGWGLLNLVLGFVYLFFQQEQKSIFEMQEQTRIDNKAAAFRILDVERKGFLTYTQADELLREMYEFYEDIRTKPTAAERYELILVLDIQSNMMIDENDFSFVEEKCFADALKRLRSRKRKFIRYMTASILRDRLFAASVDGAAADGQTQVHDHLHEHLHAGQDHNHSLTVSPLQAAADGSGSRPLSMSSDCERCDSGATGSSRYADSIPSGAHFPPKLAAALARAHASALANELGIVDSRLSGDFQPSLDDSGDPDRTHSFSREARFSSTIEGATKYAGQFDDPKLLELYKTIQTRELMKRSAGGPTWSQRLAYYAILLDNIRFDIASDCFMLFFGIAVLFNPSKTRLIYAYITFGLTELGIKLYVKGAYRYWASNRNGLDGFVTLSLFVLAMADVSMDSKAYSEVGTKALVLLRTLLFPRNVLVTNGFKSFRERHRLAFTYGFQSASHFTFLVTFLVVMLYIFAGIGQDIFGGGISTTGPGSTAVQNSAYGQNAYWPLNFNDMPSGMVTMFTLLTVNNMHVTASGFSAAYSQWAEVFFACWYALGVLLLLNVLTAVFVNQFTGYMSRLSQEKQMAEDAQLLELQEQEEELREMDLAEHQLSVDTTVSSGLSDEARRNADLNARMLHDAAVAAGGENPQLMRAGNSEKQDDGFLRVPTDAPPGVLFNLGRPSQGAHPEAPTRDSMGRASSPSSPAPSPGPRQGVLGSLAGSSGLGRLLKMIAVVDEDSAEIGPVAPPTGQVLAPVGTLVRRGSAAERMVQSPGPAGVTSRPHRGSLAPRPSLALRSPLSPSAAPSSEGRLSFRQRSSTVGADGDNEVASSAGATFNASIFASNSDRQKLQDWVQSHYPQPRRMTVLSQTPTPGSAFNRTGGDAAAGAGTEVSYGTAESAAVTARTGRARTHSDAQKVLAKLVLPGTVERLDLDGDSSDEEDAQTEQMLDIEPTAIIAPVRMRGLSAAVGMLAATAASSAATTPRAAVSMGVELSPVPSPVCSRGSSLALDNVQDAGVDAVGNPLVLSAAPTMDSTQEELQHLRQKKASSRLFRYFFPSAAEHSASSSLREWMNYAISPPEKAAVLIQFARDGEEHSIFCSRRGLACYRLRTSWAPLFRACAFFYALLKFIQRPIWTYYRDQWDDSSVFPMSGLPQLSATAIGALKLPLLLVLLFGLLLELGYKEASFYSLFTHINGMRFARLLLFLYCVIQIIMVLVGIGGGAPHLVPMTSLGCMTYLLWFNRRSLHKFRVVLRVVPRLSLVLMLFLFMVVLFAAFGPYLFNLRRSGADDDLNEQYFDTFQESAWSVFVAITSSNYPNQILPAYRDDREVFLYFFAFISIGAFGVLNLILVIVLVEFQKASQLAADIQRASRQVLLMRAFDVLDPAGVGHIEREQVRLLLDELYMHYADFKKAGVPRGTARDILIDILDVDGDGKITVQDFLFFLDVTRIKVSKDNEHTFLERNYPALVASSPFQALMAIVKFPYTNLVVDTVVAVLILSNLFINRKNAYRPTVSSVGIAFTVVEFLCLEAVAKILVRGWTSYKRSFRNRTDFIIAFGALFCLIGAAILDRSVSNVNGFTILMRVLLMLRLFMFPRNIRYFFENRGLKRFARLLRRIMAKTLTLGIVFLCTGYLFATIGVFAYGGLINRSPVNNARYDDLVNSHYGQADFYSLNFNDFLSACITLFSCLHVSDFDTVASGFTATSNERAELYFALWYVVGVLLMLNILKSFFLGEFLALFLVPGQEGVLGGLGPAAPYTPPVSTDATTRSQDGGGENALDELRPSTAPDFRDTYVLGGDLPVPPSTVLLAADARSTANQRLVSNSSGGSSSSPSVFGRKLFPHRSTSSMTGGNGDGNSSIPPQLDRKLSRQMSTSSMNSGSMRLKQPTQPHELDEEQYKKITFMRNTERVSSTEDGRARSNSALNARYVASTARVKNLDATQREVLRRRIRQLAMGAQVAAAAAGTDEAAV